METSYQLMLWRRHKGLTQDHLAKRTGLSRAYISRLESGRADPSVSSVRKIAAAMGITLGDLLDRRPACIHLGKRAMDRLARAALWPGAKTARDTPGAQALSQIFDERRRAAGLLKRRFSQFSTGRLRGQNAGRWLRASLGETQWAALLRRIDKLISASAA